MLNHYIQTLLGISVITATATATATQNIENKEDFYVITAIFNPAGYQRRYELYHNFALHMKKTDAQLVTIECVFPSLNQHEFKVTDPNNPFHIQLKSESVYWMKENLINIAVSRLPPLAKWIAWLDADIEFHDINWIELTIEALKNYSVVQVFETAEFLGPDTKPLITYHSFGSCIVHGKPIEYNIFNKWYPHPGFGFAMSVNTFRLISGLPEFDIVGGGDTLFAMSLIGKLPVEKLWLRNLNTKFLKLIKRKTKGIFCKLCRLSKPIFGYIPVTISHHWHGSMNDRQYRKRYIIISAHNFNYETDVKKDAEGLLVLADNKAVCAYSNYWNRRNTLQEDLISFFRRRNEDQ